LNKDTYPSKLNLLAQIWGEGKREVQGVRYGAGKGRGGEREGRGGERGVGESGGGGEGVAERWEGREN